LFFRYHVDQYDSDSIGIQDDANTFSDLVNEYTIWFVWN
jgi:hypothetical protein